MYTSSCHSTCSFFMNIAGASHRAECSLRRVTGGVPKAQRQEPEQNEALLQVLHVVCTCICTCTLESEKARGLLPSPSHDNVINMHVLDHWFIVLPISMDDDNVQSFRTIIGLQESSYVWLCSYCCNLPICSTTWMSGLGTSFRNSRAIFPTTFPLALHVVQKETWLLATECPLTKRYQSCTSYVYHWSFPSLLR